MFNEANKTAKIKYLEKHLTEKLWSEFTGDNKVKLVKNSIKELDALTIEALTSHCLNNSAGKQLAENTLVVQGGDVLTSNAPLNSLTIYKIIDIDENTTYHAQLEFDNPFVKDANWEDVTGFTKVLSDSNELTNNEAKQIINDLTKTKQLYTNAKNTSKEWTDGVAYGIGLVLGNMKNPSSNWEKDMSKSIFTENGVEK